MPDRTFDILIDIQSRVAAIDDATRKIQDLHTETSGLGKAFETGFGVEVFHRIGEAITEVSSRLVEAVTSGIAFNASVQDIQTSMAGVLRLTQSAQFGSFTQAKAAAGDYIEVIKAAANRVGVTYETMFETVRETQAQLSAAGITDIHQTIQAALLLTQAMTAVGVGAQNASRDVGDLLQGNAQTQGGRRLATAIGLTTEEFTKLIQEALHTGTVLDLLTTKFAPLGDAIKDSANNAQADFNRLKNVITELESEVAKPIMEPLADGIKDAASADKVENLKIVARTLGEIASAALNAAGEVIKLAGSLNVAGDKASLLQRSLRAVSEFFPTGLLFHDAIAKALDQASTAVKKEGEAAKKAGADTQATYKETAEVVEGTITGLSEKQQTSLEKANAAAQLLFATSSGDGPTVAAARAQEAYTRYIDEVKKAGPITGAQLDTANKIYQTVQKTTLAEFAKKGAAAGSRAEAEGERDARKEITDLLREDSALLRSLQSEQRLIQQNPFLGADEQQSLLHQNAIAQQQELAAATEKTQEALDKAYGSGSQADITQLGQRLEELKTRSAELGYTIQTTNFTGQIRAELTQWVASFGTAAHSVAQVITGTLNTALNATSTALTNLIFHTGNWKQTFAQAAQAIVGNIIQIVLQYTVGRAIMFAINKAFGSSETGASNAQASAAASAWAPAATAASIASYGAAAGIGLAAFLAAEVAGAAGAGALAGVGGASGYAGGGFTGFGDPSRIAGYVHQEEVVFEKPVVDNLGLNNLLRLRTFGQNPGGFASGGYTGSGGSSGGGGSLVGGSKTEVYVMIDEAEMQKRIINSAANEKQIIRVGSRAGLRRAN